MPPRLSNITKEEILFLIKQGVVYDKIAALTGVHVRTIKQIARNNDIKRRPSYTEQKEIGALILAKALTGLPARRVAQECCVDRRTVSNWLLKSHIDPIALKKARESFKKAERDARKQRQADLAWLQRHFR